MTPREDTKIDANGIITDIPGISSQTRNKDGIVISMGPHDISVNGKKPGKPGFDVGDRVWYSAWAGQENPCPVGYLLIRSCDIWLKLPHDLEYEWL